MKLTKIANGKTTVRMSKSEWTDMGKKAGWISKKATLDDMWSQWGVKDDQEKPAHNDNESPALAEGSRIGSGILYHLQRIETICTINDIDNDFELSCKDINTVNNIVMFVRGLSNKLKEYNSEHHPLDQEPKRRNMASYINNVLDKVHDNLGDCRILRSGNIVERLSSPYFQKYLVAELNDILRLLEPRS
jgi:hypothetical protein